MPQPILPRNPAAAVVFTTNEHMNLNVEVLILRRACSTCRGKLRVTLPK